MWGGAEEGVTQTKGAMAFRSSFRTAKRPHNACKRVRKQRPDGLHCTRRGASVGADPVTGPDVRHRSAPEYPASKATQIRVNGRIGIRSEVEVERYTVRVEGPDGEVLDDVGIDVFESLPQRDLIIEHTCIEGWSSIVHWGGARFSDFHARYADRIGDVAYVQLATPDGQYYVGWDMASILHPQTMLVLRQGTEPLDDAHGAPLRLATPNKYGIKCLKRIGVVRYLRRRPADYWAERSYDWYAGL